MSFLRWFIGWHYVPLYLKTEEIRHRLSAVRMRATPYIGFPWLPSTKQRVYQRVWGKGEN